MERKYQPSFSPQELILNAFPYFNASEIDELSLIQICLDADCPDVATAKGVLRRMVLDNLLTERIDQQSGLKMYAPCNHPSSKAMLN